MKAINKIALPLLLATTVGSQLAAADSKAEKFREQFLAGDLSWSQVVEQAKKEGEVNFYYWGGSDELNVWIDSVVAPGMKDLGIKLKPHRIAGTKDAIDLALTEKRSGKSLGEGSVDAVWANGENFFTLAQQDLLFGSFAQLLPNSSNFEWNPDDSRSMLNLRDFGYPTESREMPWSGEQYVCSANRKMISEQDTPHTLAELEIWLKANPYKFAYIKPPHYLGNTFVQQALYEFNPDGNGGVAFQSSRTELGAKEVARLIKPGMEYLKRINPLLMGAQNGSPKFPEDANSLTNLFKNSEIAIRCEFGLYKNAIFREQGKFPQSSEEIILPRGNMIKNKNYLVFVGNAPNPAATLVFINYMSSVESHISKMGQIGYAPGIDGWQIPKAKADALAAVAPPHFGLTQADLDANIAPDTNSSLVDIIESVWLQYIERKSDKTIEQLVDEAYSNL